MFKKDKYLSFRLRLLVSLFIAILVVLPNIWAAFSTPDGDIFGGANLVTNLNDVEGVYFSAIRQFSKGNILYVNPFDNSSKSFFHYPVYLLLGKIVALTGISVAFVYSAASFLFALLFCLFAFSFLRQFFKSSERILLAFFLVNFGVFLPGHVPESNAFFSYFFPHYIVAQFGLFTAIFCIFKFYEKKSHRWLAGVFLTTFALAMVHPWVTIPLVVSLAIWAFSLYWKKKTSFVFLPVFVVVFTSFPWLVYYKFNIFWTSFNLPSTPSLLLVLYGLPLFLAVLGLWVLIKGKYKPSYHFLAIWFVVVAIFSYLPFPFQRRFVEGLYMPIGVFSVLGLERLGSSKTINKWVLYVLLMIIIPAGIAGTYLTHFFWLPNSHVYKKIEEIKAMEFIDQNGDYPKRVLSMPYAGNFMAGRVSASIFVGHEIQTLDYDLKARKALDFFSGDLIIDDRIKLISDEKICYVYLGPEEKAVNKINLDQEKYLEKVFDNGVATVYKSKWCSVDL